MGVINMAHGEFIMVGAYVAYVFQTIVAPYVGGVEMGVWFILAIPAAFLVAGLLGSLMEVTLIRHLYGRPLDTLLATWGVALILQQAARSIFGAPNVNVSSPVWLTGGLISAQGCLLPYKRIFIIALVVVSGHCPLSLSLSQLQRAAIARGYAEPRDGLRLGRSLTHRWMP